MRERLDPLNPQSKNDCEANACNRFAPMNICKLYNNFVNLMTLGKLGRGTHPRKSKKGLSFHRHERLKPNNTPDGLSSKVRENMTFRISPVRLITRDISLSAGSCQMEHI
jgi:hypothetical protein